MRHQHSETELIEFFMPISARSENAWESGFARSILRQAKRPGWRPSPKQKATMQRIASSFGDVDDELLDIFEE